MPIQWRAGWTLLHLTWDLCRVLLTVHLLWLELHLWYHLRLHQWDVLHIGQLGCAHEVRGLTHHALLVWIVGLLHVLLALVEPEWTWGVLLLLLGHLVWVRAAWELVCLWVVMDALMHVSSVGGSKLVVCLVILVEHGWRLLLVWLSHLRHIVHGCGVLELVSIGETWLWGSVLWDELLLIS